MKQKLFFGLLIFIISSSILYANNKKVKVTLLKGNVRVQYGKNKDWKVLKINDIVYSNALIKTTKNAEVILSTKNQKFKIDENQMIRISELLKKADKSQKYLKINKLKSKLSKLFVKKSKVFGEVTATDGVRGDEVENAPSIQ